MLIRIPDEYKAIETLLGRHGIPFEVVESKYRDVLMERARTLNVMKIINIEEVNMNDLIEVAIKYIDEKMELSKYVLDHLYNESLKHAYSELVDQK